MFPRIRPATVIVCICGVVGSAAFWYSCIRPFSGLSVFAEVTGLKLSRMTFLVGDNSHAAGAFGSDTPRCIEVETDPDTLKSWLAVKPIDGSRAWQKGPVDQSRLFGQEFVPNGILNSDGVYSAQSIRQNRGDVVILDPESSRAWLLTW